MPYDVKQDTNICPVARPWAVTKQGAPNTPLGCHATQADAQDQMAEMMANDKGMQPNMMMNGGQMNADDLELDLRAKYNAEQLRTMARNGQAMPDGSYPIGDLADLANAIRAVGRGSGSHDAIRRHIMKRARALGASDQIPDNWMANGGMREDQTHIEARGVEEREYTITEVECRGKDDGTVTIAGYASTFNDPYHVRDRWGAFNETILPGAWKDTIQRADIHLLVGHGAIPIPLAATGAGSLRLGEDSHGLEFEADLNPQRSSIHGDVAYAVETGAMRQMSVGMNIPEGGDRWTDGNSERFISRADLVEISVLTRGANSNTSAGLRNEELMAEIRELRDMLSERGEVTDVADRHMQGLLAELSKLNKRRYI